MQVDVRIIAATNVDLRQLVREGRFREDLVLPAQRHHHRPAAFASAPVKDVPLLVDHFLKKYSEENERPRRRVTTEAFASAGYLSLARQRSRT